MTEYTHLISSMLPDGPGRLDQPDQPRLRDGQVTQPDHHAGPRRTGGVQLGLRPASHSGEMNGCRYDGSEKNEW